MMTFLLIVLLIGFISGAPLFVVMAGASILGAKDLVDNAHSFDPNFDNMTISMYGVGTGDQSTVLATIPMFIYAGYLLAESKTADRLVRFANALLGWAPGGLAIVTIGVCALFTVFTGASGVTIVALGGLLLPALVKQGYPQKFSLGLIAGTGSVGLLFPPALPLFVFGTVYGLTRLHPGPPVSEVTWDTERFIFAGIVPGLVLLGMLSAVAVTVAIVKKLPRQKFEPVELGKSFLAAAPELAIPFLVIAGLAFGIRLPHVAALTVVYVVVLETLVLRMIHWKTMWRVSRESMALVGAIFIIIFASTAVTNYMVTKEVPEALIEWTREHVDSKIMFLLAINGILLLVGTVMDIFSAIVIVLPLIAPISKSYGIDPYHLGVIFLLNLEVGYLHPPVGLNLFITSLKFKRPITEVMWATIPFLVTMLVALLVITYVPALTVVPEEARKSPASVLINTAHQAFEEGRSKKEVALVRWDGTPIVDKTGQQRVHRIGDCEALAEGERDTCKLVFTEVSTCEREKPGDTACVNTAISEHVAREGKTIVLDEVPLVNDDGIPVDKDGKPTQDEDGKPVPKAGPQAVKKLADCDAAGLSAYDKEGCLDLFITASECLIKKPDDSLEECQKAAVGEWVDTNLSPEEEEEDE
jgi:tripartite ATP-independent transporter DctM subunit